MPCLYLKDGNHLSQIDTLQFHFLDAIQTINPLPLPMNINLEKH